MELHHPFFRERAIKEYIQRQEKDILPRFMSLHVLIFFYPLLFLFLLVGLLAWWVEVPLFASGSGIALTERPASASRAHKMVIVLFLPAKYVSQIHQGTYVQMHIEPTGRQFTSTIEHVEARIISPEEARKRYMLSDATAQVIPQSSVAAIIFPPATSAPHLYVGDLVNAQVQIGSQRILSLLLALR